MNLRIGHGYDVHRLVENRDLILGGVNIPWKLGLLGHSDADVLGNAYEYLIKQFASETGKKAGEFYV